VSVEPLNFASLVSGIWTDNRAAYCAALDYVQRTRDEAATTRELRPLLDAASCDYDGERRQLVLYHNEHVHALAAVCSMKR
jgi:hypothetical protein